MSRIDALLQAMTLTEKLGQLNLVTANQAITGPSTNAAIDTSIRAGEVGGVFNLWGREAVSATQRLAIEESRLRIPLLFGLDVLHGHRTIFPAPLAETGAFDPDLWTRTARAAAQEAAEDGVSLTFAPMLDVCRDPRWGRLIEGPGEDPYVASVFAQAKVQGFQGRDLHHPGAVAATAKHFCAGGAATAGRDYAAADVSARQLREIYLPPFRAAVMAGCAAIMPAFNSVDGLPMTAHIALLRDYLRNELGFDGVVLSDYTAIQELIEHGVAADRAEAAALALNAGVDMDMVSGAYLENLPDALARGLVKQEQIDAAVRRVLVLKEKLGLFEEPIRITTVDAQNPEAARNLARDSARRSITLLTNHNTLPIGENMRRIAVIGPLADARTEMLGSWSAAGRAENSVTILEGLKAALPTHDIVHTEGVSLAWDDDRGVAEACELARSADLVVLCLGEAAYMSGEAACRATPDLPGAQQQLAEAVLATGTPCVITLTCGRPLMIGDLAGRAGALVATWFLGDMAGHAIADVLTGAFNPCARLPITWPRQTGQIPIFYAQRSSGRPPDDTNPFTSKYLDVPVTPLFSFGHGLSYGEASLENLRLDKETYFIDEKIHLAVDIICSGNIARRETIFFFIHDSVASVARPVLELKRWRQIDLAPGDRKTISVTLDADDFSFPGRDLKPMLEPGAFELFAGFSAAPEGLSRARLQIDARPNAAS
jgi:beta-glucosidase